MRIGCCCNIEDAAIAHAAGFDFIECRVTALLPEASDAAAAPIVAQHHASPLPIEAFNIFIPRELKIVGPEVDSARLERYVERGLARVHAVGGEIVVFGSGVARAIPDAFPAHVAHKQTVAFLQQVANVAAKHNITVVIEPLNRKESNVINSVPEAVALAQEVNHPNIQALADFYHMDEEGESLTHILEHKDWIKHVHVADTERHAPGTGAYPYGEFASILRAAGYTGRVSIECRWHDFATEARLAQEFLRRTLG